MNPEERIQIETPPTSEFEQRVELFHAHLLALKQALENFEKSLEYHEKKETDDYQKIRENENLLSIVVNLKDGAHRLLKTITHMVKQPQAQTEMEFYGALAIFKRLIKDLVTDPVSQNEPALKEYVILKYGKYPLANDVVRAILSLKSEAGNLSNPDINRFNKEKENLENAVARFKTMADEYYRAQEEYERIERKNIELENQCNVLKARIEGNDPKSVEKKTFTRELRITQFLASLLEMRLLTEMRLYIEDHEPCTIAELRERFSQLNDFCNNSLSSEISDYTENYAGVIAVERRRVGILTDRLESLQKQIAEKTPDQAVPQIHEKAGSEEEKGEMTAVRGLLEEIRSLLAPYIAKLNSETIGAVSYADQILMKPEIPNHPRVKAAIQKNFLDTIAPHVHALGISSGDRKKLVDLLNRLRSFLE